MVAEVLSSLEVPMSGEVASDSNIVTLESKNTTPADKESNPAPLEEPNATGLGHPSVIALTTEAEKPLAIVNPGGTVLTADDSKASGSTL